MSSDKKEVYGALGPPKTQPRTLDFEEIRGWNVSGRKGRGEKLCNEFSNNLSINENQINGYGLKSEPENLQEDAKGKEINCNLHSTHCLKELYPF